MFIFYNKEAVDTILNMVLYHHDLKQHFFTRFLLNDKNLTFLKVYIVLIYFVYYFSNVPITVFSFLIYVVDKEYYSAFSKAYNNFLIIYMEHFVIFL